MRYLHLDVFTDTPFQGNQLAVCPQPPLQIPPARMQEIAREMAFSETTFVFPPIAGGDAGVRIFTPDTELPMAGHPTIGTTFALAAEGAIEQGRPGIVLELGIGPIPVSLEWDDGRLAFAWMTQPLPSFGVEIEDRAAFAAVVGLAPADLGETPIQEVSCGVPYLFVPVASREAVDRVDIDRRGLSRICSAAGAAVLPLFFFTMDRTAAAGDETVYSRMLAPQFGISEDPATGGASGPLGSYLLYHDLVDAARARALISLQGVAMKRPSRIHISVESRNGSISRVRVGGQAVMVAEGSLLVYPPAAG